MWRFHRHPRDGPELVLRCPASKSWRRTSSNWTCRRRACNNYPCVVCYGLCRRHLSSRHANNRIPVEIDSFRLQLLVDRRIPSTSVLGSLPLLCLHCRCCVAQTGINLNLNLWTIPIPHDRQLILSRDVEVIVWSWLSLWGVKESAVFNNKLEISKRTVNLKSKFKIYCGGIYRYNKSTWKNK